MDAYFDAVFGELQRDPSTDTGRISGAASSPSTWISIVGSKW
jgi:hypothetical protein